MCQNRAAPEFDIIYIYIHIQYQTISKDMKPDILLANIKIKAIQFMECTGVQTNTRLMAISPHTCRSVDNSPKDKHPDDHFFLHLHTMLQMSPKTLSFHK